MMYEPNNRVAANLMKTGQFVDFIVRGAYTNHAGKTNKTHMAALGYRTGCRRRDRTEQSPDSSSVDGSRSEKTPRDVALIEERTRHDVYLTLMTGAKGIVIFSGYNNRKGFTEHYDLFLNAYLAAAKELNGPMNIAQIFLRGEETEGASVTTIEGNRTQHFKQGSSAPVLSDRVE